MATLAWIIGADVDPKSEEALTIPSVHACENCGARSLEEYVTCCATLWHCPHCDLYQGGQVSDTEEYCLRYHTCYVARRRHKVRTAGVRLNRVASLLETDTPKLLDVGCSVGTTVEAAAGRGWDAQGVDLMPDVVEYCRRRGLNCRLTSPHRLPYPERTFDVVTAWHVIEHVTSVADTLAEWRRVLKPGGVLALETPDSACLKARWRGRSYRRFWGPGHVYTFNRRNLVPLVESAEFEVLRNPAFGRLDQVSLGMAVHSIAYQCHKGLLWLTNLDKMFQLFCRRKEPAAATLALRRAA